MKLELSIEKTRVSDLTQGFQFLSHRVRYKMAPPVRLYAEDRDPHQQTSGPSVYGEADDQSRYNAMVAG